MQAVKRNNNLLLILLSTVFIFIISFSCQAQNLPFISTIDSPGSKKVQFGNTNYYLLLPGNFEISETHGKEGN